MTILTLAHLMAGTVACLSGLVALASKKGNTLHRMAGRLFVAAMVITAGGGTIYAIDRPEALTGMVGLFTCYLVLSSIHTVLPRDKWSSTFDRLCLGMAALLAIAFFAFGATAPPMVPEYQITPAAYYAFGVIALGATAGDLVNYLLNGMKDQWRIARHLWRMGFAFYIAAGSLLDGPGTRIFPEVLQGSRWLTAPVDIIGIAILVWVGIALFSTRFKPPRKAATSPLAAATNLSGDIK